MRNVMLLLWVFGILGCGGSGAVLSGSGDGGGGGGVSRGSGGGGGIGASSKKTVRANSGQTGGGTEKLVVGDSGGDVVAVVAGETVAWAAVREMLVEAAGGEVLSEWVLSYAVEKALRRERLVVEREDVSREKDLLLGRLSKDANEAALLLKRVRADRGLGDRRFELQLRRNAGLRKLIAKEVVVTDEMIAGEYGLQHGPTTEVRMIMVERLTEAQLVKDRLAGGESFIDLAVELSIDSSRRQGGLLNLISPWDDSYPQSIRTAARALSDAEVSDPIGLDGGFAILRCERKLEGSGVAIGEVVTEMEAAVRDRVEGTLMARRVRVLLDETEVSVLDGGLHDAWVRWREGGEK